MYVDDILKTTATLFSAHLRHRYMQIETVQYNLSATKASFVAFSGPFIIK